MDRNAENIDGCCILKNWFNGKRGISHFHYYFSLKITNSINSETYSRNYHFPICHSYLQVFFQDTSNANTSHISLLQIFSTQWMHYPFDEEYIVAWGHVDYSVWGRRSNFLNSREMTIVYSIFPWASWRSTHDGIDSGLH